MSRHVIPPLPTSCCDRGVPQAASGRARRGQEPQADSRQGHQETGGCLAINSVYITYVQKFLVRRRAHSRPLVCSFYTVAVDVPAVGSQWWPNCQRTSCSGPAPTHPLERAHTYTHTLQRRTGFPIRRRGILDLDKPRQESVTKGPLSARETLTVMEMIPSLCGVLARERFSGIIRKWRRTKT